MLFVLTISGLWCIGSAIYVGVTQWHWRKQLILLSTFGGANLILAVYCMWSLQRVFGGEHQRRNMHKPQDWMFCAVLLSVLLLTTYLLNLPFANWLLFGWEHMGYTP